MAIDSKDIAGPDILTGRFTSAGLAADVTETLPWAPTLFILYSDIAATNPNMVVQSAASTTNTMYTTGTSGDITLVAVAAGIYIDVTAKTVKIDADMQSSSGVNAWIAFK